jgi:hypothetical protein
VLLLAVAALLRAARWSSTALLFNDGPHFLALARAAAAGDFEALLRHPYHPLYPLAVAAMHGLVPDWERAAVTVSIVAGTLAVAALFVFVRTAFGTPAAWLAALLLALHPQAIEYCGDVQSEGVYLALFVAGLAALLPAWRDGRAGLAALAGACAGLAYLTRPEGLGIALLGSGLAVERALRGRWTSRRSLAWLVALLLPAGLVALPYLVGLRAEHGAWQLTGKKSLTQMVGAASAGSPPAEPSGTSPGASPVSAFPAAPARASAPAVAARPLLLRAVEALAELLGTGVRALRYEVLALVLIGLIASRGRIGERGAFVVALLALYAAVLFALTLNVGYVSARHALPPLVATFGHAAAAAPVAAGLLLGLLRRGRRLAGRGPLLAGSLVALALLGPGAIDKAFVPDRTDDLAERRAAEWLRAQGLPPGGVAVRRQRIAYYADAPPVMLPAARVPELPEHLRSAGARYAIIRERDLRQWPELGEASGGEIELLHRVETEGVTARVLRLRAPGD